MDYSSDRMGSRIRQLRENSGISQAQLAGFLGVDQSMVSKIESGERNTSVEIIEKISALFGCSLDSPEDGGASSGELKFAFRAGGVSAEDMEVIAAVNRIALNLREMNGLLRGGAN